LSPSRDAAPSTPGRCLADRRTSERALPGLAKEARTTKDKDELAVVEAVTAAQKLLNEGVTLFAGVEKAGIDVSLLRELHLLTAKPFLYVFNLDESELTDEDLRARLRDMVAPAEAIFLDAKIEAELIALPSDEALERPQ